MLAIPHKGWHFTVEGGSRVDIPQGNDKGELSEDQAIALGCALIRAAGHSVDYWDAR